VIAIVGPTGSGKTALAIHLAKKLDAEIISCDSRGIYKNLPALTAVPPGHWTPQKISNRKSQIVNLYVTKEGIPYHFVDFLSPTKRFDAYTYSQRAKKLIADILKRKKICIVAGGSGFYFRALTNGFHPLPGANEKIRKNIESLLQKRGLPYLAQQLQAKDPTTYKNIDTKNPRRVARALEICLILGKPLSRYLQETPRSRPLTAPVKAFYLQWPKEKLRKRINRRVQEGFSAMVEEVWKLNKKFGLSTVRLPAFESLLAEPILCHLKGEISQNQAMEDCARRDSNYAKKQRTWFKKEKNLITIQCSNNRFIERATSAILKEAIIA